MIRTTLSGPSDYENDGYCGFEIVEAREIDTIGVEGIIKKIRDRVGTEKPVYLSIDIDTLDPACTYFEIIQWQSFYEMKVMRSPADQSNSCPRYRHPGDRRLVHPRTAHHYPRTGRHQLCRGGHR